MDLKHFKMPYGLGSISLRGRSLWIVYRNIAGHTVQENARTANYEAALHLLSRRNLERLRSQVATMEVLNEQTKAFAERERASGESQAPAEDQPQSRHGSLRKSSQKRPGRKATIRGRK